MCSQFSLFDSGLGCSELVGYRNSCHVKKKKIKKSQNVKYPIKEEPLLWLSGMASENTLLLADASRI